MFGIGKRVGKTKGAHKEEKEGKEGKCNSWLLVGGTKGKEEGKRKLGIAGKDWCHQAQRWGEEGKERWGEKGIETKKLTMMMAKENNKVRERESNGKREQERHYSLFDLFIYLFFSFLLLLLLMNFRLRRIDTVESC